MSTFVCGLDLGQAQDYTALIVTEKHTPEGEKRPRFDVRHIVRFPLGTSYPTIVDEVAGLLARPPLGTDARLIIDGTGVGRAPVDMLRVRLGGRAIPVTITSGDVVSVGDDGYHRVPKRDLVGVVQVLLQNKQLRIGPRLPEAATLTSELANFQTKININTMHDSYGAWREGTHDDLVLSLALALWYAERCQYRVHG